MLDPSRPRTSIPAASWRRELLQPAVALLWTSIVLLWMFRLWPALIPLAIATFWLFARYPEAFISGRFLNRSSEPQIRIRQRVSPLQRATNGAEEAIDYDQIENSVRLPEIDTTPKWVQYLIAYTGAPIFKHKSIGKNSAFYDGMLYAFPFMISFLLLITTFGLIRSETSFGPLSKWFWLLMPPLAMLIVSYRLSFRRLYDIYTKDAAKTGRHAFPALHR